MNMISLKKRNITILSNDELTVVSGGFDTDLTTQCGGPGYSTEQDSCTCLPDTDGCNAG